MITGELCVPVARQLVLAIRGQHRHGVVQCLSYEGDSIIYDVILADIVFPSFGGIKEPYLILLNSEETEFFSPRPFTSFGCEFGEQGSEIVDKIWLDKDRKEKIYDRNERSIFE